MKKAKELSRVVKFFGEKFNGCIKKFKWIFIIVIGAWSIVSCVLATKLGPLTKEESFLPPEHWAEEYLDLATKGYNSGDQDLSLEMEIFWGVKGINKGDVDQWDASDMGKIKWDSNFNLADPNAQTYLFDFCQDLRKSSIVKNGRVSCWIESFKTWAESKEGGKQFPIPNEADLLSRLNTYFTTVTAGK